MLMKTAATLFLALVTGACTSVVRNEASCYDSQCLDPARPYCDADGTFGGEPGKCVAVTCQPDQLVRCNGDLALVCNATGDNIETTDCGHACDPDLACAECVANTSQCDGNNIVRCGADGRFSAPIECEAGCVPGAAPRCAYLEPRFLPDVCDVPAASAELRFDADRTFETNEDANCDGGIVTQTSGPPLCVVRHRRISIEPGVQVTVRGSRALALVADTELIVRGTLDLSATTATNGPGASDAGSALPGVGSANNGSGGAGAATRGGTGGGCCTQGEGGGASGGETSLRPTQLAFLKGAATAYRTAGFSIGGGGGGAATLIACRGAVTVDVNGTLAANGGGGTGARVVAHPVLPQNMFLPAGGGGAGGAIVLQGLSVSIKGALFANGGGGGAGTFTDTTTVRSAAAGADGMMSTAAAGGGISSSAAGSGGAGGFSAVVPGPGARSTSSTTSGGGGGGSVGFFEVVAPTNGMVSIVPVAASPSVLPVVTAATR